ncbi:hypothetical protein CEP54_001945 [Fusarium duplospermum]|uniref:Uncharacterized protein n=1 Tax=Fusarium duplospermum TaxID=1325734 RepID=A0A428QXR6_9HYPO|nr:hypothetical protein CEP54_001945 [Fusarium duplospermum]
MFEYYNKQINLLKGRQDVLLSTPEESEWRPQQLYDDRAPYQASFDRLHLTEEPTSRVFVHLLYARSYGIREGIREDGWLSDWALVELHQDKFEQPLGLLANQIPMDSLPSETTELAYARQPNTNRRLFEKGSELSLTGIIPEASIAKPPDVGLCHVSGLVVGGALNLTLGCLNGFKFVTRRPFGDDKPFEEWCVVSIDEGGDFLSPETQGHVSLT